MTSINIKKLLKNTVSLLLTLLIMSSILDFIRKPTVPDNLNATALYDLQGNPFFLPQLDQDKPTVLYFWGTWCSYCRYPVVSVALRSGSAQDVANYLMEHQYGFTTVNDPQGELATQWHVGVTPSIIILRHGKMDLATTGWTSYWGLKVRLFLATFL